MPIFVMWVMSFAALEDIKQYTSDPSDALSDGALVGDPHGEVSDRELVPSSPSDVAHHPQDVSLHRPSHDGVLGHLHHLGFHLVRGQRRVLFPARALKQRIVLDKWLW